MLRIALLMLVAGVAQADDTFLVTGTMTENPWGDPSMGQAGQSLQFMYTVNPLVNPDEDPSQRGPITSLAYSINGGAFIPDNGWGSVNLQDDSFTLYPGSGSMISYDPSQGKMFLYDHSLTAAYANVTSFQKMGVQGLQAAQAPEIDPRGLASGLMLLIGGLLVLRGGRHERFN